MSLHTEVCEQTQEDLLSLLEGFGIDEVMDVRDYENLKDNLCQIIINNFNKLKNEHNT